MENGNKDLQGTGDIDGTINNNPLENVPQDSQLKNPSNQKKVISNDEKKMKEKARREKWNAYQRDRRAKQKENPASNEKEKQEVQSGKSFGQAVKDWWNGN